MAAPSFPSFKSFPEMDPGPSQRRSPSPPKSIRKDEKRRKDRNKEDKDRRKREKHHSGKPTRRADHALDSAQDDERLKAMEDRQRKDAPPVFYSDRKGDRLNVTYGGIHAGDIPKYRLVGGGKKILGLSNAWTIVSRSNKGIEVAVGTRRRLPALTDSSSRALLAAAPTRSMIGSDAEYKYEEIDGFLRLPSRRGRPKDQPSYREITLAKNDSDSESSSASSDGSSDENSDSRPLTSHQQTLKSLERQITSDPSSVMAWLSLLSQTLSTVPHTSKNATKARSEISLSILSRALSSHPSNNSNRELRLKYLKAGEEVWHESKLRAEWEDALKVGGMEIWMEWMEWRIRRGIKGINGIVEDAERILQSLGDGENDEISKLRVIWRVAVTLQNAGFTERATALFQAQAELIFEVPQSLYGLPLNTLLDALEEFWESEVPRVGEPGAKGWAAWVSSGRPDRISNSNTQSDLSPETTTLTDPYTKWWYEESRADQTLRLPTRSTDNDSESDPYATILFSDNRPLLLSLQTIRAKNIFRLVWLSLLGLHIPGLSAYLSSDAHNNRDDRWSFIHLTSPAYLTSIFPSGPQTHIISDSQAGILIGREKEYSSGFGPIKHWSFGVLGPLDNLKRDCGLWCKDEVMGIDEAFVRRIFEQLRWGPEDFEWDYYALAFEAALSVKNALKISRSFLSVAQDSLPHWAAHGRLERLRGRTDDARKVYQTVLTTSPPSATRSGTSQLWWDWAEMEWLAAKPGAALQVALRSVGVEATTGITILRAKRKLEDMYENSGELSWKEREAWIKLRGLLELLTSTPTAMLLVFDEYLLGNGNLIERTASHESLTVASLLVLYHHGVTLRNPTPPSLLRDRLEKGMEEYPSNTIVLGMFLEAEKGRGVWGRVRGLLGEHTTDGLGMDKDVPRRVAEVWVASWEKGRWDAEKERTRSGLAAAVHNERTRGSLIIRRIALEFEIRAGELQRAKKMLYGAIGENPLAKELYLLAFGPLRSVFGTQELNAFADTMAERELRLRKGLDEFLDGWEAEKEKAMDGGDSDESGDELEYNASELRRLMPY